jgi:hypothetical protein
MRGIFVNGWFAMVRTVIVGVTTSKPLSWKLTVRSASFGVPTGQHPCWAAYLRRTDYGHGNRFAEVGD